VATFSEKRAVIDGKEIATGHFLKNIEEGKIDFAVLLASPAVIPSLAKFAKILGPRGLMPNPKAGTICPDPEKEAEKFSAGQITLKPVSESLVIQTIVGKLSSPAKEIEENIAAIFTALGPAKVSSAFLKSTMSPAVRLKV
ncbi:MAG: ribosomal L1 domain-containing protein, partial [bacterium]|nr:ribosomal L1 domain-containing protein [bacterium]